MVLMFTDLVGSVDLKARLGNHTYVQLIARHDRIFKDIVRSMTGATILKDTGDGFLAGFATASDGIRAALRFQWAIRHEPWEPESLHVCVGLHVGEVAELEDSGVHPKLVGLAADFAARVMGLAEPDQILMTRTVYDDARQYVRDHPDVADAVPELRWMAHGAYAFKGGAEPVDVFEVGSPDVAPLRRPGDSLKARRADRAQKGEWRPAPGVAIPDRPDWVLERAVGDDDAWIASHARTKATHRFKFGFNAARLSALKHELTLFRLLREVLGDRRDVVKLHDARLDETPYYLESEYTRDLATWARGQGGLAGIDLASRIDIVAATAEAVAAVHSAGVLHRNITPRHILVQTGGDGWPRPCLADFGNGAFRDALLGPRESLEHEASAFRDPDSKGAFTYAPPEALAGREFTAQGDIYSLGVLLYQMVVGDLDRPLAPHWKRDISDPLLQQDIAACVAHRPDSRLPDATELVTLLRSLDARRREREHDRAHETERAPQKPPPDAGKRLPFVKLRCGAHSGQAGKILKLVGRQFTLGREGCAISTDSDRVSRRHARLQLGPRGWMLKDLASRNGTFVNHEQIVSASLQPGDLVVLGRGGAQYRVVALEA